MNITEKAAYLKGLLDGLKLDEEKPEGKLLAAIVDTINDLALELADTQDDVETLDAYAEELDEDLGAVEEFVYGDDYDDYYDEDDYEDEDYVPFDEDEEEEEPSENPAED